MKRITNHIIAAAAILALAACTDNNKWQLSGTIEGAADKQLIVENQTFVGWQGIDTVTVDKNGRFSISGAPKGYADIYRLRVDGHTVYFPIDSIEHVTVNGSLDNLEHNYFIEGTPDAPMLITADSLIYAAVNARGADAARADSLLKRDLANLILTKPHSIVAFYIINKTIGDKPLFSAADSRDVRILGAVANAFNTERPNDPRTARLGEIFLKARAAHRTAPADTIMAETIGLHDIVLYDTRGKQQSLADVADASSLVILNFIMATGEGAPAYNRELNKIYTARHGAGLQIYQVAVDDDETAWRTVSEALPWIAVRNAGVDASRNIMKYNVQGVPTSFIINGSGEIVERVDNPADLAAAVARHMR